MERKEINIEIVLHLSKICTLALLYIKRQEEFILDEMVEEINEVAYLPFMADDLKELPTEKRNSLCYAMYEVTRKILIRDINGVGIDEN